MQNAISIETCLERANRLRTLADHATSYDLMLTYEQLAEEWLHLASKASRNQHKRAVAPRLAPVAPTPARGRGLRAWFR
ncbi:MAG: hypothetical protein EPO51_10330 [Phenylobacterium sp.]|uniref:hypothetical protein n=1 Tax=Phenylobacterium sp. TaxID=1871053 RepID=UPI00120AB79F|nr:hypothetical protein [Phenylobacterium sp.]TAJ72484.1 MAG: hypothetical protein EPO51_10330 [Phenylobacterium sp.]